MKTISYTLKKTSSDLNNIYKCNPLYIDIETTGLSAKSSIIYLVGLLYIENNELTLKQYLCQKEEDEYELLYKLNSLVSNYDTLIHYNGNSFDIPFIKKRLAIYNIKENFSNIHSIDFFSLLRPLKNFLGTCNLKLPTIMDLLNYTRLDPFNGGQLIEIFKYYILGDKPLEKVLLLHNEEDMVGLYQINHLLPLIIFKHPDLITNYNIYSTNIHSSKNTIILQLSLDFDNLSLFERKIKLSDNCYIKYSNNSINLIFRKKTSKLKYFYSDYKNYYYLPDEDYAIHKSVACFMPTNHRIKANKKNAYIYKSGTFIECPTLCEFSNLTIKKYYNSISNKSFYLLIDDILSLNELHQKELFIKLIQFSL